MIRFFKTGLIVLFFFSCSGAVAQTFYTIKGIVIQLPDSIPLYGATVVEMKSKSGTVTDSAGHFNITLEAGKYKIEVRHINIITKKENIRIPASGDMVIYVEQQHQQVSEVTIAGQNRQQQLTDPVSGKSRLTSKEIKQLPQFMGESDIIAVLRTLPGVQAGGEGDHALHVRGGGPGENLVFLDYLPIYNPSHLLGIYSVFNTDIIRDATLYKGVFPASLGGRTSSVIQINTLNQVPDKTAWKGSIGLIHSKLYAHIPFSESLSLQASFRRSYLEPVFWLNNRSKSQNKKFLKQSRYYFYDLFFKINYRLNEHHRLFLDFYTGEDGFSQKQEAVKFQSLITWGNMAGSLRWNFISNQASVNCIAGFSQYHFGLDASFFPYKANIQSAVGDYFFKAIVDFEKPEHYIKTGFESTVHQIIPTQVKAKIFSSGYENTISYHALCNTVFINDEFAASDRWNLNGGLRLNLYFQTGPADLTTFDQNGNITDTLHYGSYYIFFRYFTYEPRFSASYKSTENKSLKFSYSQNSQVMHLITIGSVSFPSDIWFPATSETPPEKCHQVTAGYFYDGLQKQASCSFEIFYKYFQNQVEYTNSLLMQYDNTRFEKNLVTGDGHAFGMEIGMQKNAGPFSVQSSYTLSKSIRVFPDLNNGKAYPAKYDRTHDFSINISYQPSKSWELSAFWVYSTGNAVNLPAGRYMVQGIIVNDYNTINSYRMPPFHRLNLSAEYKVNKTGRFESSWNFSVYNVYNRANPFYLFFVPQGDLDQYELKIEVKKIALFPVMPSVSWNFKF